ncbi:3486_t:CDS:1, partial [Cetraspora pellucida]
QLQRNHNTNGRSRGQFQRILNTGIRPQNQPQGHQPQNNMNTSTHVFVQQYIDLVEGSNPFARLQVGTTPQHNAQFHTALFLGLPF